MIERRKGRDESSRIRHIVIEAEGNAHGEPTASVVRSDAQASTPRHNRDQIPGTRREEQEQSVWGGERV